MQEAKTTTWSRAAASPIQPGGRKSDTWFGTGPCGGDLVKTGSEQGHCRRDRLAGGEKDVHRWFRKGRHYPKGDLVAPDRRRVQSNHIVRNEDQKTGKTHFFFRFLPMHSTEFRVCKKRPFFFGSQSWKKLICTPTKTVQNTSQIWNKAIRAIGSTFWVIFDYNFFYWTKTKKSRILDTF